MKDFTFEFQGKTLECLDTGSDYTIIEWKPNMTQIDYDDAVVLGSTVLHRWDHEIQNDNIPEELYMVVRGEIQSRMSDDGEE